MYEALAATSSASALEETGTTTESAPRLSATVAVIGQLASLAEMMRTRRWPAPSRERSAAERAAGVPSASRPIVSRSTRGAGRTARTASYERSASTLPWLPAGGGAAGGAARSVWKEAERAASGAVSIGLPLQSCVSLSRCLLTCMQQHARTHAHAHTMPAA